MSQDSWPNTLTSRNNLALAYQDAGRLAEAIPLFERTLTDLERVLGADHPYTLTSPRQPGQRLPGPRLAEAIPLHERTLTDRERVLGADHPDNPDQLPRQPGQRPYPTTADDPGD